MINREDLIGEYAQRVVEDLDTDTLVAYAIDKMMDDLRSYTDEALHEEVSEYYPDLLEG